MNGPDALRELEETRQANLAKEAAKLSVAKVYPHYFKNVSNLKVVDVYRVLELFNVTDPCIQHAVKKLLVAGGRGTKDIERDISEAIATLERWKEMRREDLSE